MDAGSPFFLDAAAVGTLDVDARVGSGHAIEACSEDQDVTFYETFIEGVDASFSDLDNWRGVEIHNVDIVLVETLVIVHFQGRPLCAECVWLFEGSKQVSLLGVLDARASLLGPESVRLVIRSLVDHHVFIGTKLEA